MKNHSTQGFHVQFPHHGTNWAAFRLHFVKASCPVLFPYLDLFVLVFGLKVGLQRA